MEKGGDIVSKKKFILLSLLSFCLIATLFVSVTSSAEYDPWCDINDDGIIDIVDIVNLGIRFGEEGTPTRNVNVTNFPSPPSEYELLYLGQLNITAGHIEPIPWYGEGFCFCGGYSRMGVLIDVGEMSVGYYTFTIYLRLIDWNSHITNYQATSLEESFEYLKTEIIVNGSTWVLDRYPQAFITETKAPYFKLVFDSHINPTIPAWALLDVYVYLRNE
jgi:hypothetical protein